MTDASDQKLREYSRKVELLELALDRALTEIRAGQRDGLLIPLEAANKRLAVLTRHLAARRVLSEQYWGQDPR